MGDIVNLGDYSPHNAGEARCIGCGHEWVAVIPEGRVEFEGPECGLLKGAFVGVTCPDNHLICDCGNDLFFVTADGDVCARCGVVQVFD